MKCIHYFASTYYSEMGQLRDCTREYRKEKKRKRLERLKAEETAARISFSRESSLDAISQHDGSQTAETTKEQSRSTSTNTGVDMYKLFDGSALMAIGGFLTHERSLSMTWAQECCCKSMSISKFRVTFRTAGKKKCYEHRGWMRRAGLLRSGKAGGVGSVRERSAKRKKLCLPSMRKTLIYRCQCSPTIMKPSESLIRSNCTRRPKLACSGELCEGGPYLLGFWCYMGCL